MPCSRHEAGHGAGDAPGPGVEPAILTRLLATESKLADQGDVLLDVRGQLLFAFKRPALTPFDWAPVA
jgi:hypothetical protein